MLKLTEPRGRGERRRSALPLNWSPNNSQSVEQEDSVQVRAAPATTQLTTDTQTTSQFSGSPENFNMNKNMLRRDTPVSFIHYAMSFCHYLSPLIHRHLLLPPFL